MRNSNEIICALATPAGEGGISIIRASGEGCIALLKRIFVPSNKKNAFEHAYMAHGYIRGGADGEYIDECLCVCFYAPRSYTREDVFEIHCHGGKMCVSRILGVLTKLGAKPAEPGEFTYRAFMNGRIDLSSAEAVMSLIGAKSEYGARASLNQLRGGVSAGVKESIDVLTDVLSGISALADFPDEIDEYEAIGDMRSKTERVRDMLVSSCDERSARAVREGVSVALCGRPNTGKSSLLNALLAYDRAIVSDIPGTTRDELTESLTYRGMLFTFSDTAGIRNATDEIEKLGVQRAERRLTDSDIVLLLIDSSSELTEDDKNLLASRDERFITVLNKCDLNCVTQIDDALHVSCKNKIGINELMEAIYKKAPSAETNERAMILPRHIELCKRALASLDSALNAIGSSPIDFVAIDIREALAALYEITGESVDESVIDRVFENFCVGK